MQDKVKIIKDQTPNKILPNCKEKCTRLMFKMMNYNKNIQKKTLNCRILLKKKMYYYYY